MTGFKQLKTAKLGIVLQLTEVSADATKDQRLWEVHDVERNRGFRVTLPTRGSAKLSPDAVETAIGLAVERFMASSSEELVAGPMYEVQVGSQDFDEIARLQG